MHAADYDLAILQRLAQHLQCVAGKLRQLIEKEHAVVGQAHLAGAGNGPAAHDGGGADAVMRAAEGALFYQPRAAAQKPGHRVDGAGFQRFLVGQRRQNPRQALGQHGFAGARRADKQQIVPARGGNLHRPACLALAAHIGHIRAKPDAVLVVAVRRGGGDGACTAQVQHHILRTARRVDGQPLGHSGLGGVLGGQEKLLHTVLHGGQCHRQHAGHGAQCAVQTQLPQKGTRIAGDGQLALRGQNPDKDR